MRILLDTNVLLWFIADDEKLEPDHRAMIENTENKIIVSIVSLWEIAIKVKIGRLSLDVNFETFLKIIKEQYCFYILNISDSHLIQYIKLPLHHRDPFDRLIYSQAKVEDMIFLYTDDIFKLYEVA